MGKPLILDIDEAKTEMVTCINDIIQKHNLPFYIVEMVISNIHTQIQGMAKSELEMAKGQVNEVEEQQ